MTPSPPATPEAPTTPSGVRARIVRLSRNVRHLARSTAFYETRLGFVRCGPSQTLDPALACLWGASGQPLERQRLQLGASELELVGVGSVTAAGHSEDSRADDLWFQHFAIRCPDLGQAFARLYRPDPGVPLPRAISHRGDGTPGPILLPESSGGVTAFKFRDPDGHPVELLGFPARPGDARDAQPAGIDHSAISVANAAASVRFYERWLGFSLASRQCNTGIGQDHLDGLDGVRVDVVGLQTASGHAPHLELLGYRFAPRTGHPPPTGLHDVVSDRLVIRVADLDALRRAWTALGLPVEAATPDALLIRDPDRHLLMLTR
ncbi:VOC family protein [Robbsia sp. Bb-Pol-6]|uniref:VOC family protein n=1 Tax=Robbsia betulipollinis TaxID=2981849 RepID=A0ABT3ZJT1_9BURK|nr:VOC family protein [Robbsia betulipollinis]MCY0386794.1 VOC family protein [Robbsia betulipollinis]